MGDAIVREPADAIPFVQRVPWLPPALWLLVVIDDSVLLPKASTTPVLGLLDEPAHLATSVIGLLAMQAVLPGTVVCDRSFVVGTLVAGNLIDLDHVPMTLGYNAVTKGTPRPYSHSLTTVVALLLLSAALRERPRRALLGAASGVLLHLFRDVGTGRVSLLWPLTRQPFTTPATAYAVGLGALALLPPAARLAHVLRSSRSRSGAGRARR